MISQKYSTQVSGFTILELIIVVIIVGVLASLAIPKFYGMVERSRSVEALNTLMGCRTQMELCYIGSKNYASCFTQLQPNFSALSDAPNSHFIYGGGGGALGAGYSLFAQRNTYELNTSVLEEMICCDEGFGSTSCIGPGHFVGICTNLQTKDVLISGAGVYKGM